MRIMTAPASAAREMRMRRAEKLRWVFLTLAVLWAIVSVVVGVAYHAPEPTGVLSITIGGHTYVGNPPMLTLLERDPTSAAFGLGAMAVGVLVGLSDTLIWSRTRSASSGTSSIVAGVVVTLFSLFGLLLGLASIGVVGTLIVLSGVEGRSVATTRSRVDVTSDT
ncbi:MAG: hypothetical protein ACRDV0_03190 [Acidimicrobiales bacterium]